MNRIIKGPITITTYNALQAAFSIRTLRIELIEGKPLDNHAPLNKHYRLHSKIVFRITVVIGLSAVLPFIQLVKSDVKTFPEANVDLPIVK